MQVGDRVRAPQHHWLRANCKGTVETVDFQRGDHSIYVRFDDVAEGRGINGCELWMNPRELTVEDGAKRKGNQG